MHTVTSYGIALMRKSSHNTLNSSNKYEFLFIKKRTTYAFITFVKGIYNKSNDHDVIKLFNNMSIEEKVCIMSLNFSNIWYMSYLKSPRQMSPKELSKYESCKSKFEKKFLHDNGAKLMKLLKASKSVSCIWEMPKGMKNKNESDINTAIREFYEETNISKNKYRILWDVPKFEFKFVDENVEYRYIYYPAIMIDQRFNPLIDISITKSSLMESSDIKFLTPEEVFVLTENKNLYNFLISVKKKIKKYA
jgi:ADP-ribose pyrophosphatase YjhB (NUDIX family)